MSVNYVSIYGVAWSSRHYRNSIISSAKKIPFAMGSPPSPLVRSKPESLDKCPGYFYPSSVLPALKLTINVAVLCLVNRGFDKI